MIRMAAVLLSVATGFTGLVYEVVWQKILATLLGSHSSATAAVLALFLGGLAAGYSFFGRVSRRRAERAHEGSSARLLRVYGLVEVGIGVYALAFPVFFAAARAVSTSLPLGGVLGFAADLLLSGLLIGPPSVLMGATIPLLTQALAHDREDATRFHSLVYAFNTLGAFAGALAAGFWLVPAFGLTGVLSAVAAVNILAGLCYVMLDLCSPVPPPLSPEPARSPRAITGLVPLSTAAAVLGFAMMAIQTVIMRLGALAFGSSEFIFATVVAVFVLCIAIGSLTVSLLPRVPRGLLVAVLWLLLVSLVLLYAPLQDSTYYAHVLRSLFRDQSAAFHLYHFTIFLASLVVIGLPVALSGATLPLLFHELHGAADEFGDTAGRLYSYNTVGSLLGALLGGYVLLGWLDLADVFRIAIASVVLAVTIVSARAFRIGPVAAALFVCAPGLGAVATLDSWEPERLSAGLYRQRQPTTQSYSGSDAWFSAEDQFDILFYRDDPTASIAVKETRAKGAQGHGDRTIVTNGKSDGSLEGEYPTTALLSIVPALLAGDVERAFVVGWGTGVSAAELAALDTIREVVVAEISPGVIEAAPLFDHGNLSASNHPAIRISEGDAYRTLLRSEGLFDVIVSEPSNPWVTGVEMLYSVEFLQSARARLAPGGVYSQWLQLYETDDATVALVLRTFASVFDHVAVWYGLGPDLLVLGVTDPIAALDLDRLARRASRPDIAAGLARAKIGGFPELVAHELLPVDVINALAWQGPVHTLFHPRLSHSAARAFFVGARGWLPVTAGLEAARTGSRNSLARRLLASTTGSSQEAIRSRIVRETCRHQIHACLSLMAEWEHRVPESTARDVARTTLMADPQHLVSTHLDELPELVRIYEGSLDADRTPAATNRATHRFLRYYHHAAPFPRAHLAATWRRCEGEPCEVGREQVEQMLGNLETPLEPVGR